MLRLRAGTATLIIGPRSSAGHEGLEYCLQSEDDIRLRLLHALNDPAGREAIRRFWGHWQSDIRLPGVKDRSIVERIARLSVRGPLIAILVIDTSLHRRDTSGARQNAVAEALAMSAGPPPSTERIKGPIAVKVSSIMPASIQAPPMVTPGKLDLGKKQIGDWTIAEKLFAILPRTADSRKLSQDAQDQL